MFGYFAQKNSEFPQRYYQSLMTKIGLATWFNCLGITGDDPDLILEHESHVDRADNNPKLVTIDKALIIFYWVL